MDLCLSELLSNQSAINSLNQSKNVAIPVQAIKAEHVFRFDASDLATKLVRDGFVINFEYGKGRDLIYDYEEMLCFLRHFFVRKQSMMLFENSICLNF